MEGNRNKDIENLHTFFMLICVRMICMCVFYQVNLSADGVVEEGEIFRLRLEVPGGETGVQLGLAAIIVTIIDNDCEILSC